MLKTETKKLLDIINLIYINNGSSDLNKMRRDVLELVIPLFRGIGATFFLSDNRQRDIDVYSGISCGLDTSYSRLYEQYYHKLEPFKEVIASSQVCTTSTMTFPSEKWEKLEYYKNFLRPQNIYRELIICIRSKNKLYGKIGIFRQKDDLEFASSDLEKALMLSKHLSYILKNARLREEYEEKSNIYRVLTEFPCIGIVILDASLRPIYHNDIAVQMCLDINKGTPDVPDVYGNGDIRIPDAIAQDCQTLHNVLKSGLQVGSYCNVNDIYSPAGRRYSLKSFVNTQPLEGVSPPSFLILLEDCTEMQQIKEEAAKIRYGLTDRELDICRFINEGLTNADIADKLFISRFTVETHIRHIFEKTNTRHRTELFKMMGLSTP